jgi:hypothetical protein
MAGISVGETVDHLALLVGLSREAVEMVIAAEEAVCAETIKHIPSIGFADIQPLRGCLGRPSLFGISAEQQQRLELSNRIDMPEDELTEVLRD